MATGTARCGLGALPPQDSTCGCGVPTVSHARSRSIPRSQLEQLNRTRRCHTPSGKYHGGSDARSRLSCGRCCTSYLLAGDDTPPPSPTVNIIAPKENTRKTNKSQSKLACDHIPIVIYTLQYAVCKFLHSKTKTLPVLLGSRWWYHRYLASRSSEQRAATRYL